MGFYWQFPAIPSAMLCLQDDDKKVSGRQSILPWIWRWWSIHIVFITNKKPPKVIKVMTNRTSCQLYILMTQTQLWSFGNSIFDSRWKSSFFFHVNRWKRVHEEGKSIISLVHIMLQVNVTFSLKFCNLGCFSNSFVTPCIVSFWQLPDDCFSWSMKLWVASTCFWRSSSLRIYIHIYVY